MPLPKSPSLDARTARDAILEARALPPSDALRADGARWYRRYTPLICDYLLGHLFEDELPGWGLAFTALHELVGHAYGLAAGGPDEDAWARFHPVEQLLVTTPFTLLPEDFDHLGFVPHYQGFLRFLGAVGFVHPGEAERIAAEYATIGEAFLSLPSVVGVA